MNCDVFGELRLASLGPRPVSVLRNILAAAGPRARFALPRAGRRRFDRTRTGGPAPFDADSGRKEFYP